MSEQAKTKSQDFQRLVEAAVEARRNAYAPFSKFLVGAAILTSDGRVFRGVNVENSSYGLTICAERVAATAAVAEGAKGFKAIAVATEGGAYPCGACRQFLFEWGGELEVALFDTLGERPTQTVRLSALLPNGFRLEDSE